MPRSRSVMTSAIAAVLAIAVAGFGGWYFFIRGDEPPPVNLADAVAAASTATGTAATETAATETAGGVSSVAAGGDLSGTWTVDAANSFVGYRIGEELARVGSTTAVGRTSDVTGTLEFDGSMITSVDVTADLSTLKSDDDRRDGQLKRQALETNQFPEASFVLAEPIAINGDPASGAPISARAVGDLTIHGVTNRVELELQGQLVDGQVVVVGSTVIVLADYDIEQPTSMAVLSVADEGTMEMQLVFVRA